MVEKDVGGFVFGIRAIQNSNGNVELETQATNRNISIETIIMLVKAFIKIQEDKYFEDYKDSLSR